MTARTIKACDPDLDQVILDITPACNRLARAEEAIILARKADNNRVVARESIRAQHARETLAARASRLNIQPRALRLIVDQHEALRTRMGRRPSMEQIERALDAASELLAQQAITAESALYEAEHYARRTRLSAEAGQAAVDYLRASA